MQLLHVMQSDHSYLESHLTLYMYMYLMWSDTIVRYHDNTCQMADSQFQFFLIDHYSGTRINDLAM